MKKPNNKKDSFSDQLERIYKSEYSKASMDTLDLKRPHTWRRFIIALMVVLTLASAAAWSGFLFFGQPQAFTSSDTSLTIEAPKEITATQNTSMFLNLTNNEKITLVKNEVTVYLPNGFILISSSLPSTQPSAEINGSRSNIYNFSPEELKTGQNLTIEIIGQVIAEKDKVITIGAKWRYQPDNLSSTYEQNASIDLKVNDANLSITTEYLPQTVNQEETVIKFTVKNISDNDLKNSRMNIQWPDEFTSTMLAYALTNQEALTIDVSNEELEITEGDNDLGLNQGEFIDYAETELKKIIDNGYIEIPFFKKSGELSWKLSGKFNSADSEPKTIQFSFSTADASDSQIILTEENAEFQIIREDLIVKPVINGLEKDSTLNFDSTINFSLIITNKSKTTLGHLKVKAVIDSPVLDWETLNDSNSGDVSFNRILWSAQEIERLDLMLPEDEIQIDFTIKTKPYSQVKNLSTDKLKIISYFEVEINKIDTLDTVKKVESPTIINTFNSNTQLISQAEYFDENGEAVGSGPLPPIANQKTVYQIKWLINNSFHELENIKVEAELPSKVAWELTANTGAGNIKLVGTKVIWEINRLPSSVAELEATFSISVIPTVNDVNKILSLLAETVLTATDKETGGNITITAPALNTNLDGDVNASGKGLVQP